MFKKIRKLVSNKSGFSLTEVMIGMSILTVAIVSASSLLVGLIDSNKNNVKTLQAYYKAQEGLEIVRNIRDTNWLHNSPWLGDDTNRLWGVKFEKDNDYVVELKEGSKSQCGNDDINRDSIISCAPFTVNTPSMDDKAINDTLHRIISIKDCPGHIGNDPDCALVVSKVTWSDGQSKKLELEEIITDWKGGVL